MVYVPPALITLLRPSFSYILIYIPPDNTCVKFSLYICNSLIGNNDRPTVEERRKGRCSGGIELDRWRRYRKADKGVGANLYKL